MEIFALIIFGLLIIILVGLWVYLTYYNFSEINSGKKENKNILSKKERLESLEQSVARLIMGNQFKERRIEVLENSQNKLKEEVQRLNDILILVRFDSIKLTEFKTELYKKLFLEYRANGVDYKEMNEYILIPTSLVYKLGPFYKKYCELLQEEKDYLLVKKQEKELKSKQNK